MSRQKFLELSDLISTDQFAKFCAEIQDSDLSYQDPSGNTLLHVSVAEKRLQFIDLLLKRNANANTENYNASSPYMWALKSLQEYPETLQNFKAHGAFLSESQRTKAIDKLIHESSNLKALTHSLNTLFLNGEIDSATNYKVIAQYVTLNRDQLAPQDNPLSHSPSHSVFGGGGGGGSGAAASGGSPAGTTGSMAFPFQLPASTSRAPGDSPAGGIKASSDHHFQLPASAAASAAAPVFDSENSDSDPHLQFPASAAASAAAPVVFDSEYSDEEDGKLDELLSTETEEDDDADDAGYSNKKAREGSYDEENPAPHQPDNREAAAAPVAPAQVNQLANADESDESDSGDEENYDPTDSSGSEDSGYEKDSEESDETDSSDDQNDSDESYDPTDSSDDDDGAHIARLVGGAEVMDLLDQRCYSSEGSLTGNNSDFYDDL